MVVAVAAIVAATTDYLQCHDRVNAISLLCIPFHFFSFLLLFLIFWPIKTCSMKLFNRRKKKRKRMIEKKRSAKNRKWVPLISVTHSRTQTHAHTHTLCSVTKRIVSLMRIEYACVLKRNWKILTNQSIYSRKIGIIVCIFIAVIVACCCFFSLVLEYTQFPRCIVYSKQRTRSKISHSK